MGFFDKLFRRSQAASGPPQPLWTQASTRCLNAYIKRDYSACVEAGGVTLLHEFVPTVGAVTVLGMRRLGQLDEAEALSCRLLKDGMQAGRAGGTFMMFMMIIDGALDPEKFLEERIFGGARVEVSPELACQVYFYWGAMLLTKEQFTEALRPLRRAVETECGALERRLAEADLLTAEEKVAAQSR